MLRRADDVRGRAAPGVRPARQPLPPQPPRDNGHRPAARLRQRAQPHLLHPRRQLRARPHHRRAGSQAWLQGAGRLLHRDGRRHAPAPRGVPVLLGRDGGGRRRDGLPFRQGQVPPALLLHDGPRLRVRGHRLALLDAAQARHLPGQDAHDAPLVRHDGGGDRPRVQAGRRLHGRLEGHARVVPAALAARLRPADRRARAGDRDAEQD
mmetsp:Transcript_21950/g.37503  ORF Transcript_21950/g.37503 Transcript_21950/m.37503 type:complete len:208 (-) Transcript_21950:581-1204(-)